MSSLILKRLCSKKPRIFNCLYSSFSGPHFHSYNPRVLASRSAFSAQKDNGLFSLFYEKWGFPYGSNFVRFWGSEAATEASTCDGLTVDAIIANNWVIYDENESDWKSHASAIAQSIHLVKKRLRVSLSLQPFPVYLYFLS